MENRNQVTNHLHHPDEDFPMKNHEKNNKISEDNLLSQNVFRNLLSGDSNSQEFVVYDGFEAPTDTSGLGDPLPASS